jgi:ribonuclease P protein component
VEHRDPGGVPPDLSFPRSARVLRSRDFTAALRTATLRARKGPLSLAARDNGGSTARLGLVIPKRQVRSAVRRNRIKRVVRESFRARRGDLPPLDLVVLLKDGRPAEIANERLFACLEQLWERCIRER